LNNIWNRHDSDDRNDENATSFHLQLGPILLLTGIFFLNFIARIMPAPLMPTIEKDLGVDHGEAGSLFLFISSGYFISLLGAGLLSSRLTHRKTIVLSATTVGIALLGISLSNSLWAIRLGLFMLGMAAGIYLPSGIATLTALISARHWGKGIAIHELAPNLSFVAAPLISEALLPWLPWRGILAVMGGTSVLAGIAFACFGRGGQFPGEAPSFASFKSFLIRPTFWIMTALFGLGISGSLGVYTMLPLYLVTERGIERSWANTLVAFSRVSGLGMAFLAGWATDRLGARRTMGGVFLLTGITTVLLSIVSGDWMVIIIFLQPMLAVSFFPAGFAALSRIGPPSARNVVVSLTIPLAFLLGGGVVPFAIGVMGDIASFALGIALVGGLILTGLILSLYVKLPEEKQHV
jgi:NNP family nitrate/nitrite transporter-like MFS transporter